MALSALLGKAIPLAKGAAGLGNKVLTGKGTLTSTLGALFAAEAIKQGAVMPVLRATGIARAGAPPPAAAPAAGPQPMNMQELIMYGSPGKSGLFGSSNPLLGGQAREPGLIERRFEADNQFRNAQLNASLESHKLSTGSDIERQRLISTANTILGAQQADRDKYSARQNTLSNMSANMAVMVSGAGINNATNYGQAMVQQTQAIAPTTAGAAMQMPGAGGAFGGRMPRYQRGYGRRQQMGAMGPMGSMGGYGQYGGMM